MAKKIPAVNQAQAEEAIRTLLRWAGEDPRREGLLETPKRVAEAYRDWFSGYAIDPREYLSRTFEEMAGYDERGVLRDIEFESHCEHHMAPIIGKAHVGYLPTDRVVGIGIRNSVPPAATCRPPVCAWTCAIPARPAAPSCTTASSMPAS